MKFSALARQGCADHHWSPSSARVGSVPKKRRGESGGRAESESVSQARDEGRGWGTLGHWLKVGIGSIRLAFFLFF